MFERAHTLVYDRFDRLIATPATRIVPPAQITLSMATPGITHEIGMGTEISPEILTEDGFVIDQLPVTADENQSPNVVISLGIGPAHPTANKMALP